MGGFPGSSPLPGLPTNLRTGHTSAQEVQNQKVLTVMCGTFFCHRYCKVNVDIRLFIIGGMFVSSSVCLEFSPLIKTINSEICKNNKKKLLGLSIGSLNFFLFEAQSFM